MKVTNQLDSFPLKGFLFGNDQSYPECHASTIIHLKNGEFIAAWFGGTEEKNDDVGIWMTKGKPGAWVKHLKWQKLIIHRIGTRFYSSLLKGKFIFSSKQEKKFLNGKPG
jgi:hypothetical protein